jgi:hypothetical protein
MKAYKVVSGVLVVGAGQVVRLTKEQAAPRTHKLASLDGSDDEFTALEPLQFIVGEELGIAELQIVQQPFVQAIGGEAESGKSKATARDRAKS